MKNIPLLFPFFLGLFALFFGTIFFPSLRLFAFAPFFAMIYQRKGLIFCMWITLLCSLLVDLLSTHTPFGLFSISSVLTTACVYHFKHSFFEEKLFSIPCYTAFISVVFTFFQSVFLYKYFSFFSIFTLFLVMPLVDALYAFFWFTCPFIIYNVFNRKKAS